MQQLAFSFPARGEGRSLSFTYNPRPVMKLSYNCAFLPEGTRIVCYNRASFLKWTAFSHGFRK
ncbi:hypothetical protein CRH15_12630 [Lelliottia amnigena]|nr:hypothetical protein CO697_09580 [Lelliottia amnigena]PEG64752.1 hypothetical protein CRH15_12630 [Lelliottia amnigena]